VVDDAMLGSGAGAFLTLAVDLNHGIFYGRCSTTPASAAPATSAGLRPQRLVDPARLQSGHRRPDDRGRRAVAR
jgi:hypothetical protein